MIVFHFSQHTGELLGSSEARPDPMMAGAFLIPAFATASPPPSVNENERAVWRDGAWTVEVIPAPTAEPALEGVALAAAINAEADRRVLAASPLWKQLAALRQAAEPSVQSENILALIDGIIAAAETIAGAGPMTLDAVRNHPAWPAQ